MGLIKVMNIYLATPTTVFSYMDRLHACSGNYILETYHAIKKKKDLAWIHYCKSFLLDSGAYTYMRSVNDFKHLDWDKYIHEYALFILKNKIKLFFELDIDKIIGHDNVKKLTADLEKLTMMQSIPVWHRSRGLDEWHRLIEKYKYISLSASGNNGSSEWTRTPDGLSVMRQMNQLAIKKGVKVHALGFTKIDVLDKIPFHSVDSTAWMRGVYGSLYMFNGRGFDIKRKPEKSLMKVPVTSAHNWTEWVKFQRYAENNL